MKIDNAAGIRAVYETVKKKILAQMQADCQKKPKGK